MLCHPCPMWASDQRLPNRFYRSQRVSWYCVHCRSVPSCSLRHLRSVERYSEHLPAMVPRLDIKWCSISIGPLWSISFWAVSPHSSNAVAHRFRKEFFSAWYHGTVNISELSWHDVPTRPWHHRMEPTGLPGLWDSWRSCHPSGRSSPRSGPASLPLVWKVVSL